MVTFLKVLLAVPPVGLNVSLRRTVSFRFRRNTRLPALVGLMARRTRPALVATFRDFLTRSLRPAAVARLPACWAVIVPGPGRTRVMSVQPSISFTRRAPVMSFDGGADGDETGKQR